jgi:N-acyl homoserine lactone hydrolase
MLNQRSRTQTTQWLTILLFAALVAFGLVGPAPSMLAQARPQAVQATRIYVFDCGYITVADPKGFGLTKEEVVPWIDKISVASFLIVHPKGTLLWDTGVMQDALVQPGGTTRGTQTVTKTLKSQLTEIGYSPSDITYLALSHLHTDHSANANDYAGSTWLVRKPEHDAMFGEKPYPSANNPTYYSALKDSKTTIIEGDYDVFGDGTVVIKPTPGHTPGHQVLFVKLAKTGPVVLSGDLYHYPQERNASRFITYLGDFDKDQTRVSREALEAFITKTHAQLWIQHDFLANAKLKKSPAYYE